MKCKRYNKVVPFLLWYDILYMRGKEEVKEAINNFVNLLIKGDFLVVLLVVLILVIITVIVYLVRMLLSESYQPMNLEEGNEEAKVEEEINDVVNENLELTVNNQENEVMNFENEQEEKAIISADELDKRLDEMKIDGTMDDHEKEIERYESEQEEKAIISYDELLKRASTGYINYEEREDLGGLTVSKVDFNKAEEVKVNNKYLKEETFLQSLKEFRKSL